MSRSLPDSSRKLEGGGPSELPRVATELPDKGTEQQMASFYGAESTTNDSGDDGQWLLTAQQCFRNSTDFFDGNLRRAIEESMDLYRSKHPAGSKYNLPSFQKRSRLFRPKIRTALRKKEASIAEAFFSTQDLANVSPKKKRDPRHQKAAQVQKEMLNYRLSQTGPASMHWFATVIGGFQDASRQGFVVGKTEWDHAQAKRYFSDGSTSVRTVRDTPRLKLIPCENLRVDPNCDWLDPINSSSYLIELEPLSIREVLEQMAKPSTWKWRKVSVADLLSGSRQEWDSIRQKREGNRQDRYDQRPGINEFETIWIHTNIVRIEGEDYVYKTIGTEIMLTDPMPLAELDPRGYRGYVWGYTVLESHNPYPDGEVQMLKPVQEEINEVANMRADAAKLATQGRYFYKRGSAIDTDALVRFVPGSAIEVTNIQSDVRWDKAPNVDRGAFEEGNILNQEMGDLSGTFMSNEVAGNRKLNETVGGMNLLDANASKVTEYSVRTYSETFVEPALAQILDLMCLWETDESIADIVGDKLGMEVAEVFSLLSTPMNSTVSIGFGATNPESRIRRIQIAVGVTQQIDPMLIQSADKTALLGEVWGSLGIPDVSRFFPSLDEGEGGEMKRLQDENTQLRQQVEAGSGGEQVKLQIAQLNAETQVRLAEMKQAGAERLAQLNNELKFLVEKAKGELSMLDLRLKFEKNEIERQQLYMQREALSHTIQMAEREFALAVSSQATAQQNVEADRADAKEDRDAKAAAGKKPAVPDATPPGVQQLINNLRQPASGMAGAGPAVDVATGQPDMPDDAAGVVARGNYGAIPGVEG